MSANIYMLVEWSVIMAYYIYLGIAGLVGMDNLSNFHSLDFLFRTDDTFHA